MNLQQLKKSLRHRLQLEPIACELDDSGRELEPTNDDWLLHEVTPDFVRLENLRTAHQVKLGKDHIHHYSSNPNRSEGGHKFGFLTLHVQIFLKKGMNSSLRPNSRPGERVSAYHESPLRAGAHAIESSELPQPVLVVLQELSKSAGFWYGPPLLFNKFAAHTIYGSDFGDLLVPPIDYYSALIVSGYLDIASLVDSGIKSDGTPDITVNLELTPKAYEALTQSKPQPK